MISCSNCSIALSFSVSASSFLLLVDVVRSLFLKASPLLKCLLTTSDPPFRTREVAFEWRSDTESCDFVNTDVVEPSDRKELTALLPNRIAAIVLMTFLKRHLAQSLGTRLNLTPAGEATRRLLMMACIGIPKHLFQLGGERVVMNASAQVSI
jgi:hypothetical protein